MGWAGLGLFSTGFHWFWEASHGKAVLSSYHLRLSNLKFFPVYARTIQLLEKPRIPKYLDFKLFLRVDRGRTNSTSEGKGAFLGDLSSQSTGLRSLARRRWCVYHAIEDNTAIHVIILSSFGFVPTSLDIKRWKTHDSLNVDCSWFLYIDEFYRRKNCVARLINVGEDRSHSWRPCTWLWTPLYHLTGLVLTSMNEGSSTKKLRGRKKSFRIRNPNTLSPPRLKHPYP